MSSELVEQLRSHREAFGVHYEPREVEVCIEAADRIEALEADKARLREDRMKQIDYSCDLQRIIEDLCGGREIREPKTTARHHYDMAVAALARRAREGGNADG